MSKIVPNRVFEDYDPPTDLVTEEGCDTHLIYLPGFKKEQLKVQLTISGVLKISGERPLGGNRYRRFQKEIHVSPNCDTKHITAKFEGGILYIRQPKLISSAALPPAGQPQKTSAETSRPQQQPSPKPQVSVPPSLPPSQPQSQQHAPPPPPPLQPPSPLLPPQLQSQKQASPSQPPPPSPPQLQPQKHAPLPLPLPPPSPQLQSQKPASPIPPLPPPQLQTQEEAPAKGRKEETSPKGEDEASSDESEVIHRPRQVFQSGLFRELRKPDNLKKLGVSVLLVVIIAFYISYMFKSLMGNGHNIVSDYDPEL